MGGSRRYCNVGRETGRGAMSDNQWDEDETGPGTRVQVYAVDGERDLGLGTYVGMVALSEAAQEDPSPAVGEPDSLELSEEELEEAGAIVEGLLNDEIQTPKIMLDSGEIVYGFQCWWHEATSVGSVH